VFSKFILIVDDNPTSLALLSASLEDFGYAVKTASDGESALILLAYHRPSLILLDVTMPGISGFETCQRIKANPATRDVPLVFMTALCDVDNKSKGLALGAVDYLTKTFHQEEVIARVKIHLQMGELLQTLRQQNEQMAAEVVRREQAEAQLKTINQQLESRVKDGTDALTQATDHLQQAQDQVIQSEKFSTLGELVAGVAHEINNPVGCMTNNVNFMAEYGQSLLNHIALQQRIIASNDNLIQLADVEAIENHAEDIALDHITEDLPKLIESMAMSGDRIKAISQSLRTFARTDKTHKQAYDLHTGIDGTLLILRHRLKANGDRPEVIIHKQYGQLPKISCYPGQINQVFMNVLANAIDALEDRENDCQPPAISVETVLAGKQIEIKITDNAGGISETIKRRIFESQFTTKTADKGTGLGLSIAHKIVTENHSGQIECSSTTAAGTTFQITLPVSA